MSVEQVRLVLSRWGHAKEIVRNLDEMKTSTRELLLSLQEDVSFGSQPLTGMPASHSLTDSVSRNIIQRESIERKLADYDKMIDEAMCLKMRVDRLIATFQPLTLRILYMRFTEDLPWEVIANKTNLCVTAIRKRESVVCEQLGQVMIFETLVKPDLAS